MAGSSPATVLSRDSQRLGIEEPKLSEEQEEMGVTVRWRNVGHRSRIL